MSAECRPGCGACCIAPSITSPIPGMPQDGDLGKPAGVRCAQLDAAYRCRLFGLPGRPAVCVGFRPGPEVCGNDREEAMTLITRLERLTDPSGRT